MIIKTLKARILRVLKPSLPAGEGAEADSPPPSPVKPAVHTDAFSDDASFFDAREAETPTVTPHPAGAEGAEPLEAWELVDQDGRAAPAEAADPLLEFPARCPPGGERAVVLYTTTLRGVRRTFEDCNGVRALLECLAVAFQERDVSMDRGLRDQLWALAGDKAVPPRLFVLGRDLGGAAQVLALHEEGRLVSLLPPPPPPPPPPAAGDKKQPQHHRAAAGSKCEACGGLRFAVCGECDGSRKVFDGERGRGARCSACNENGLVMCPLCL
ncbi:hypothetical protein ACP4OV_012142 [Aristida adscensionis]